MIRSALRHAVEAGLQVEQFARGEEGIDVQFLRHHPDRGARRPRLPVDVAAPDPRFAAGLVDQTGQDVDQRRFAGPVGAEQPEQRPARDREVDTLQRFLGGRPARRLVGLGQAPDLDRLGRQRRGGYGGSGRGSGEWAVIVNRFFSTGLPARLSSGGPSVCCGTTTRVPTIALIRPRRLVSSRRPARHAGAPFRRQGMIFRQGNR